MCLMKTHLMWPPVMTGVTTSPKQNDLSYFNINFSTAYWWQEPLTSFSHNTLTFPALTHSLNTLGSFTVSGLGMKTLLELISFTKECWACSISFHYRFSCHCCSSNFTYIWQLFIFSLMLPLLNELKTSVSSRVAYLDYHCLLAQWMEVSISVTTAGFHRADT